MQGNMQKNAQTLAYSVFFSYLCRNFFAHCRRVDFSGKEIAPVRKPCKKCLFVTILLPKRNLHGAIKLIYNNLIKISYLCG